ncbi:MAG: prephenate dehydrogenase [Lachnospiraceae bacterium]|nr:prephenate dehydrogenase [Lachnospiraceae bacterium]
MEWINRSKVLIVGLGLMGGSYAKALKRLGYYVSAIDKSSGAVQYALDNSIIDAGSSEPDEALISEADTIIFALYPGIIAEWIRNNQSYFRPGIIITDVTGIKGAVVYDIQEVLRDDVEFIAAHPMAGRELSGVENSDERIFREANYIVVPTDKNSQEAIEWCENLGRLLGFSNVSVLSPDEHDRMIAYVSQLTHCIAVSLMTCHDDEGLADYTGDSFRDLTRIARINENMWTELFFMNKDKLLEEMDAFINEFQFIRYCIENEDSEALKAKMRLSTERRKAFDRNRSKE